jgi:hypothetical protein
LQSLSIVSVPDGSAQVAAIAAASARHDAADQGCVIKAGPTHRRQGDFALLGGQSS